MRDYLFAALGGAAGTVCRLAAGRWMQQLLPAAQLPAGTLFVNLTGSLLIGLMAGLLHHRMIPPALPLLLITGFLGGFTTFSAFSLENLHLVRNGAWALALWYAVLSTAGGLLLAWLGYRTGSALSGSL